MSETITTHVADAQARLSWQLQGKPQFAAVLGAVVARVQLLEDVCQALVVARALDDAVGVQLDRVGHQVGQDRHGGAYPLGESDDLYRRKIRARIACNESCGTAPDLHAIARALWPDAITVHVVDVYPAGIVVTVALPTAPSADEAEAFVSFVLEGKAAGVGVLGIAWYVDATFGYGPAAPEPPIAGYDDGTGSDGGSWAEYIYP